MQYTSKDFQYLQKVFYLTKCLSSNVKTIIQIKIKYCYGESGNFTLYNLKKGKT